MTTLTPATVRLHDLITAVSSAHPDALDRITGAIALADHLGEVADHLVGHFVDQARRSGASWTEIGRSMGVSKQAAQQRFVPRADDQPTLPLTRFTPRTRNVLSHAQAQARRRGHHHIGALHLLLGLLDEPDALAVQLLVAQGLAADAVRDTAERALPESGPA